ncbi:MAG: hypothetical protein P4L40_02045, partial [Terracidiphilus sp.]|nr:hypothetical protein [Terracidiphilus sp.]
GLGEQRCLRAPVQPTVAKGGLRTIFWFVSIGASCNAPHLSSKAVIARPPLPFVWLYKQTKF